MPIIVYCKECGKKIRVPEGPPGRFGNCPQCKARVAIPAEDEKAPPPPEKLKKAVAVVAAADSARPAKPSSGASLPEDAATPPEAHTAVDAESREPKAAFAKAEAPAAEAKPNAPEAQKEEKAEPSESPRPAAKDPPAKPDASKKAAPPKPRAPTGKPPRIALDMKKIEAAASAPKTEKSADHAKAKGSAVQEQYGSVKWDTRPDLPPSRAPYFLAAAAVLLGVLGYGAWYFFMRTEAKRLSPEDRKKLQYEVPPSEEEDLLKRLRDETKGAAKTPLKPEAPMPEAPAEKAAPAPEAPAPKENGAKT